MSTQITKIIRNKTFSLRHASLCKFKLIRNFSCIWNKKESLFKKWTTSFLNWDSSVLQKKHNEKKHTAKILYFYAGDPAYLEIWVKHNNKSQIKGRGQRF